MVKLVKGPFTFYKNKIKEKIVYQMYRHMYMNIC